MAAPIDFYFDFSSPYGYLGAARIDALAARFARVVAWRPILLGAVFKLTGAQPLPAIPLKGDYAKRDLPRFARLLGVPIRQPSRFPIATMAPARAFYFAWDRDPALARRLGQALFRAYFVDDRDISDPQTTAAVAAEAGFAREEVLAATHDPALKERLRRETDAAIARGVFGSPWFVVDGEPFWGADRLDQLERWLETGGW